MVENENILVGSLLARVEDFDRIAARVTTADFEDSFLASVFEQIRQHVAAGKTCDSVSVANAMRDQSPSFDRGDWARVVELTQSSFGLANLEVYADAVREFGNRRRLRDHCARILGNWATTSADEMAADLQSTVQGLATHDDDTVLMCDAVSQALARMDRAAEARAAGRPVGVPSGLQLLDNVMGGAMPGELIGVAARTSVGKTAFLNAWALHAAKQGYKTLIVSLEETPADIAFRSMASEIGYSVSRMRLGYEKRMEVERKAEVSGLGALPIWINTRKERLSQLIPFIAQAKRKLGISLAIVDHIGLVKSEMGHRVPRNEQVGEVSRSLKQCGQRLEIPIIAAIQLNREAADKEKPALHHLAESGNIERDINVGVFLHRKAGQADGAKEIDVEIGVLKSRYGMRGWLPGSFVFDGPKQRFIERPQDDHA